MSHDWCSFLQTGAKQSMYTLWSRLGIHCLMFYSNNCLPIAVTKTLIVLIRCTSIYGTPTMFIDMLNQEDLSNFDLTSLRTGTVKEYER